MQCITSTNAKYHVILYQRNEVTFCVAVLCRFVGFLCRMRLACPTHDGENKKTKSRKACAARVAYNLRNAARKTERHKFRIRAFCDAIALRVNSERASRCRMCLWLYCRPSVRFVCLNGARC